MSDTMTPAEIRACLKVGDFTLHGVEDADDWKVNLTDDHDSGALIAFTTVYTDLLGSVDRLDWWTFLDNLKATYKGQWDSPGAFARHRADCETEFGTPQEQRGRRAFFERYADVIDWEADAERPEMSDYTIIPADPEGDDDRVYVFEAI